MGERNRSYHLVYIENSKQETVTINRNELEFILNALCRMEADDIWDMYTTADSLAFRRALKKIRRAYHAEA